MTYQELMAKVKNSKSGMANIPVSRSWNYNEPCKMIVTACEPKEGSQVDITVAFKASGKIIEKTFQFTTEGKASFFWNQFVDNAFPDAEDRNWDDVIGRPFSAEIVKNDSYDNLHVLSGYRGDYPEEVEGLE